MICEVQWPTVAPQEGHNHDRRVVRGASVWGLEVGDRDTTTTASSLVLMCPGSGEGGSASGPRVTA